MNVVRMSGMVLAIATLSAGCTTTMRDGRVVAGVDLLSLPSYQTRAWVPNIPVVREVCAAADWYGYAWQNTPWQMVTAHLGVLAAGEERGWWNVIDGFGDDGDDKAPVRPPLPNATVRVRLDGDGNAVSYTYAGNAPVLDIDVRGDNNGVKIEPMVEEKDDEAEDTK